MALVAGRAEGKGKWLKPMVEEARWIREWDLAEGARLMSGIQRAMSELLLALFQLRLLSPKIDQAGDELAKVVQSYGAANNENDRTKATARVSSARDELATAVGIFVRRKWWERRPRAEKRAKGTTTTAQAAQAGLRSEGTS